MRTIIKLFITAGMIAGGTTPALAQVAQSGPAAPLPGTGNSSSITSGNRANNAEYNHLINSGNDKPKADDETRPSRPPTAATATDIRPGSGLRDIKGVQIGTIVSVDANQAVVETGGTKIGVPLMAFGKDDRGLLLGMTADKFNELVAKAKAH